MIFRGQSDSTWKLIPSAFRSGGLINFAPQPPTTEAARLYLRLHLHAEVRAITIFLKAADGLGFHTPLDYTRMKDGYNIINPASKSDEGYDGLDHNPGHCADCKAAGPHSGPYRSRNYRRVRYAGRRRLAGTMIEAGYDCHQPFPPESLQRATGLAQHHGVPTRFLDWSESPFVASYFAAYNASSFAGVGSGTQGQEIAVIFLSTYSLFQDTSPVLLVEAPRHENSYLLQQKGVFTNFKKCNDFFLEHERWPSLEDYSSNQFQLHRARLPATEADNLLRELFDLDITRHSLMPSLSNAATAYQYAKTLYEKTR
ncbi:FRG domain-containing protein [uncultured Thiodictyon sp.]|uniref:FRG domain-containing protein n=1 Tax=uncultured Thiodictyon sp. TaxID=1846217 RepID=UPI0025E6E5EC|nr:FRG domain-containing protein [uncultured Thiodictyon sp.]